MECATGVSKHIVLSFLLAVTIGTVFSQKKVSRNPYFKYVLPGSGDSTTFYLSEFNKDRKLPLIVFIQGSGFNSLFSRQQSSIIPTSGHIDLTYLAKGKAKILIVEKPGVRYLDEYGPGERNMYFDANFSLDSWSRRVAKTIKHVVSIEQVKSDSIMLIGHSEGGVVAAKVAKLMQGSISKVCILAGEGTSQLYSLYTFAKSGVFFKEYGKTEDERLTYLLKTWNDIRADSTSTTKFFWGFTYLRWHSFLRTSVLEELSSFRGSVLIMQGEKDTHVAPESARILYSGLLAKGVKSKLLMIEDADHSFNSSNITHLDGWSQALEQSLEWMLE